MIEARQVTFDWAGTPYASTSEKKYNGDVVQSNYIPNPSAVGPTASITGATVATDTAMGGSAFRSTATSATSQTFLTTTSAPAVAGQRWYTRARMRMAAAGPGARRMQLACRFRDAGGNTLTQPSVSQDLNFSGTFRRWTGTANASTSEEYVGANKRTNLETDPAFRTSAAAYSPSGNWTRTWDAAGGPAGMGAAVFTRNSTTPGNGYSARIFSGLTVGTVYTVSFQFRATAAGSYRTGVIHTDFSASLAQVDVVMTPAKGWVRSSLTFTAAQTSEMLIVNDDLFNPTFGGINPVVGQQVLISGVLLEAAATMGTYFDGSTVTPLTGKYRAWSGTAFGTPSVERAADGSQRVNLANDPQSRGSFGLIPSGKTGWVGRWFGNGGAGTESVLTGRVDGPVGITSYVHKTWTTMGTAVQDVGWTNSNSGVNGLSVAGGTTLSVSTYIRGSRTQPTRDVSNGLALTWYDATGASIGSAVGTSDGPITSGTWVRYSVTATAPANAVYASFYTQVYLSITNWQVGDSLDGTGLLVEVGPQGAYFDGSSVDASVTLPTGIADSSVYDLSISGVAPANTAFVDFFLVRAAVLPATGDIIWSDNLVLTQSNSASTDAYFDGDSPSTTEYINVTRPGEISTDEWIEIDGVPLNTLAYNVTTWGGNRLSPPNVRGANVTVPGLPGAVFMSKELDTQDVTLNMWVQGSNADGSPNSTHMADRQFDANWKMLRRLLFQVRREMTMTKRWYDYDDGAIHSATGKVQYNGGLEPQMTGRGRALFSVNLLMNDPFFYETTRELDVSSTQQKTWQEEVVGDWRTTAITATINGPRVNPKITVTAEDGGVFWMQYNGTLVAGDSVAIDVDNFTAVLTPSGGTARPVTGRITHDGGYPWLAFEPGNNTIVLTSNSGAGAVSIAYKPVWF